jgi:beta-aspartyl-peptidase (threonine type)
LRLIFLTLILTAFPFAAIAQVKAPKTVLVVHGGAGTITKESMTPEIEKQYREKLEEALRKGNEILQKGGSAVDAVEATIRILEDSPLFNAGKGAVFTHEGRNELDAAIMDGSNRKAGAVGGVTIVKNPISAARAVMDKSPHVLLIGRGAELFATKMGLEIVDPSYFWTERRWKQLQEELVKEQAGAVEKHSATVTEDEHKFGTVGAVALDANGHLAAGTSTGGTTNKYFGRLGDSPIIGAGTYANEYCGVSATGTGEYFIRWTVARDIAALMEYKGMSVRDAADQIINKELVKVGGDGGVIALDRNGNFAMPFNTSGMYRGYIRADGTPHTFIFRESE